MRISKRNFIEAGWLSHWVLWENSRFRVITLRNPNRPVEHGGHIVVEQKEKEFPRRAPHQDYPFFAEISVVAAAVQRAVESTGIAPHCNIQFNGNWAWRNPNGGEKDVKRGKKERAVHAHVYPRTTADPYWGNPAYLATHQEQVINRTYEERCFNKEQRERLKEFLEREIPAALQALQESF